MFVGVSACGSKNTYSMDKALHVRLVLVLFGIGSNGLERCDQGTPVFIVRSMKYSFSVFSWEPALVL